MKKLCAIILMVSCMFVVGCASVEMPINGEVVKFRGFAADMKITVPPSGPDQPGQIIDISAHATEGPLIEGAKSIAPFAALMLQ